jgi:hypothetical protein
MSFSKNSESSKNDDERFSQRNFEASSNESNSQQIQSLSKSHKQHAKRETIEQKGNHLL